MPSGDLHRAGPRLGCWVFICSRSKVSRWVCGLVFDVRGQVTKVSLPIRPHACHGQQAGQAPTNGDATVESCAGSAERSTEDKQPWLAVTLYVKSVTHHASARQISRVLDLQGMNWTQGYTAVLARQHRLINLFEVCVESASPPFAGPPGTPELQSQLFPGQGEASDCRPWSQGKDDGKCWCGTL